MELRVTRFKGMKIDKEKVSKGTSHTIIENRSKSRLNLKKRLNRFNKLVGYSRVHDKNYHFHEKTYESCFLPKIFFKSTERFGKIKDKTSPSASLTPKSKANWGENKKVIKNYLIPACYPTFK